MAEMDRMEAMNGRNGFPKSGPRIALLLVLTVSLVIGGWVSPAAASPEGRASARGASYVLSIIAGNATRWVDASTTQKSATYGFQVQNNGDSDLPICDLELYPWTFAPDKWSCNFIPSSPFQVPSGETKSVLVVIYPAADAEAKRYTFQLKAKGSSPVSNSISINLDVRQYAGVHIKAPPAEYLNPGDVMDFDFEIQNTGNGKDKFLVSVEAGMTSLGPHLKDGNNWTNDLAPTKIAIKTVEVQMPFDIMGTEGGEGIQLTMTVQSNFNSSAFDVNWTFLFVNRIFDLSLAISPQSAPLLPGEQAEFTVAVLNLGNGNDNISLNVTTSFDSSSWTVRLAQNRFELAAQRQDETVLKVTPPLDALAGGGYRFDVTATSAGPPFPETPIQRMESLAITILPVERILLPQTYFRSPGPVTPGAAVQFSFNFTNGGNRADTLFFDVTEVPLNWTATVGPARSIDIGPGATMSELLTVVPSPNLNESMAQSYQITVRVSNDEHSFVQNITFEVQVAPVHAIDLEQPGGQDCEVNLFVTGRQTVSLVLDNEGNAVDNISLSLSGPEAIWGQFETPVVQLAPGEKRSVRLDITVPGTTETPSTHPLAVIASSLGRPGLTAERMLYITVRNFDPGTLVPRLKVFLPGPQLRLTEGDTLSFPVSVLCTGSDIGNVSIRLTGSEGLDISYEILVTSQNLSAGENYTFMVVLRAGHPNGTVSHGTIEVQAMGEGVVGTKQRVEVTLQRAPRPAHVVSMEGLGIALAIFLALGGIAVGWNEVVLLALLNLLLPLYVKLRHEEVLDLYTRGKIHGYIIANPGEHYNSIRAQLRLKNGTLAYHLRVLERECLVKTARDGMYKRFYPQHALIPRRKSEFSAIQEIVLENVNSSPGITQNELARKMGVSGQVVNYHVRSLVNAGVLRLEREGRVTRCFPK